MGQTFSVETAGVAALWAKVGGEVSTTITIGGGYDKTKSTTSTLTTANSVAEGLEESITYIVGEHGEAAGFYRIALFASFDVYFLLKTNLDNSKLVECTAILCARSNNYFALDYDADSQDFNKTSTSKKIVLKKIIIRTYPFLSL